MSEERYGDWIETYTGNKFYPLDPRPEEIHLEDIVHGLTMICRFSGQCKRFYSVAQHSLNVMREVADLTKNWNKHLSLKLQAISLLHDSSEALGIADVCSPAKKYMPEYKRIEKKIMGAVWKRFDLVHTDEEYEIVDYVDKAMGAYEASELMKCVNWDISFSYLVHCDPHSKKHIVLDSKSPSEVKKEFSFEINRVLNELKIYKEELAV